MSYTFGHKSHTRFSRITFQIKSLTALSKKIKTNFLRWKSASLMNEKQKRNWSHLLILKDNQVVYSQPWSKWLQLLVRPCEFQKIKFLYSQKQSVSKPQTYQKVCFSWLKVTYTESVPSGRISPSWSTSANVLRTNVIPYVFIAQDNSFSNQNKLRI